jgi:hypothetical protein
VTTIIVRQICPSFVPDISSFVPDISSLVPDISSLVPDISSLVLELLRFALYSSTHFHESMHT